MIEYSDILSLYWIIKTCVIIVVGRGSCKARSWQSIQKSCRINPVYLRSSASISIS